MSSLAAIETMFNLEGYVAIVTGGATGIGWMITQGLASRGAKVYITGRRKEVLEKSASSWTGKIGSIIPIQMDVTSKESIAAGKKLIQEKEGKLHILVNNAGQVGPTSHFFRDPQNNDAEALGEAYFNNESFEDWSQLYQINTFSLWFTTMAFLGLLEKGTKDIGGDFIAGVVNITSISGVIKQAQDHFCYNSSKSAASHITKMLSTEFALKGIPVRVNAVSPGVYESEMTTDEITPEMVDKVGKGISPVPARRPGRAAEVAGTVVYLSSLAGCYTNGQEIVVDGGYVAVNPSTV
ncbi:NAD(P)-binding protein [Flagelloscypha sp. PMI_526]|nr:NAD(P)-binding protein [Flagelloscypha sp. PMI_526]